MFEVVASQRSKGRLGFSPAMVTLSVVLHTAVLLGASQLPTRAGPMRSAALPDETVTFLRLLQVPETPVLGKRLVALASKATAPPSERANKPRMGAALRSPAAIRGIPPELPDVVPPDLVSGAFLPGGLDAPVQVEPGTLNWTAEPILLGTSTRSRRNSTGELADPSRISTRPTLLNEGRMRRMWRALYPDSLNARGIEGEAIVRFVINTDGSVDPSTIHTVSASHPEFGDATAMGALEMRFRPARQRGRVVRVHVELPIR